MTKDEVLDCVLMDHTMLANVGKFKESYCKMVCKRQQVFQNVQFQTPTTPNRSVRLHNKANEETMANAIGEHIPPRDQQMIENEPCRFDRLFEANVVNINDVPKGQSWCWHFVRKHKTGGCQSRVGMIVKFNNPMYQVTYP